MLFPPRVVRATAQDLKTGRCIGGMIPSIVGKFGTRLIPLRVPEFWRVAFAFNEVPVADRIGYRGCVFTRGADRKA